MFFIPLRFAICSSSGPTLLTASANALWHNSFLTSLFFKNNTLDAYNKTQFYKSKEIYTDQNLDLFNQIDLGVYSKDIYTTVTLASYVNNDPVEIHKKKLQDIQARKNKILMELEVLKQWR